MTFYGDESSPLHCVIPFNHTGYICHVPYGFADRWIFEPPCFNAGTSLVRIIVNCPLSIVNFSKTKTASFSRSGYLMLALPIFPASPPASIVGADELNFWVRDGNRWTLVAINTNLCRLHKAAVMSKAEAFNLWCAFRDSNPGPTD